MPRGKAPSTQRTGTPAAIARAKKRSRRYYLAHKAKIRARSRAYYWAHKAERQVKLRAYRARPEVRAKLIAKHRLWRKAHPRLANIHLRRWRAKNPRRASAIGAASLARRRARRHGASGDFTWKQWLELCAYHGGRCAYCGRKRPLSVDHRKALTRGGSNWIRNILPACVPCNQRKRDMTERAFRAKLKARG